MHSNTKSATLAPALGDGTCEPLSRRQLLRRGVAAGGAFATWSLLPVLPAIAGTRDPRFLLVILRGGLDGLAAVMPVGDPDFARVRGGFMEDVTKAGQPLKLDGMFALNPAMSNLAALYAKREALVVHAVATPYRERSHFDGQEILESGLSRAVHGDTGWLNRALALAKANERAVVLAGAGRENGVSIGYTVPLVMRGAAPVLSWSPKHLPHANDDTILRLMMLYESRDPVLAEALRRGVAVEKDTAGMTPALMGGGNNGGGAQAMLEMAEGAARLLSKSDGPRVGALSIDGWDTHAEEKPGTGRLGRLLGGLDQLFASLNKGLEPVWKDTVVAVVTEFGRTVRINGTAGTDHGTATCAFFIGGAVKGGRVLADWPGLSDRSLHEGRDLKPTTDLRAVLKSVLVEHMGLDRKLIDAQVFPNSDKVAYTGGLFG